MGKAKVLLHLFILSYRNRTKGLDRLFELVVESELSSLPEKQETNSSKANNEYDNLESIFEKFIL